MKLGENGEDISVDYSVLRDKLLEELTWQERYEELCEYVAKEERKEGTTDGGDNNTATSSDNEEEWTPSSSSSLVLKPPTRLSDIHADSKLEILSDFVPLL